MSYVCLPASVEFCSCCCELAPMPYAQPRTCTSLNSCVCACVCSGNDCILFGPKSKNTAADQVQKKKYAHLLFPHTRKQTNFIKAHASYPYYLDKSIHHVRAWLSVNIAFCGVLLVCVHGEDMRIARWSSLLGRDGMGWQWESVVHSNKALLGHWQRQQRHRWLAAIDSWPTLLLMSENLI